MTPALILHISTGSLGLLSGAAAHGDASGVRGAAWLWREGE